MAQANFNKVLNLQKTEMRSIDHVGPLGSRSPPSILTALQRATHMKLSTMVYGKPAAMETVLRAVKALSPPATSKAVAAAPSVRAQKILCRIGGSG